MLTAYGLVMTAYVFDVLNLGLIGTRGRVILCLIGAALAYAWWAGAAGWLGVGCAVASVIFIQRGRFWLEHEDGVQVIMAWLIEWLERGARAAGNTVRWLCSPLPREEAPEPVFHAEDVTPVPGDTRHATDQEMRWTPGWDRGDTGLVLDAVPGPGGLHSVETYADWLPGAVEKCGGYNEAARRARELFDVSRSKFARDLRNLKNAA